jgi:hypothetical protein
MGINAPRLTKVALTGVLVATPIIAVTTSRGDLHLSAQSSTSPSAVPAGSGVTGSAAPAAASPADVTDLTAAIAPLKTTSHDVVMTTHDSRLKGSVDPARHAASLVATAGDLELDEVVDNGQVWLKMDLGASTNSQLGISKDQWMKLDPGKLNTDNNLPIRVNGSDPIDMPGIVAGVTSVTRVDPTHLKGVVDLTKVTGHNTPDPDEVKQAGDAAKAAAYTVATDTDGRITSFRVDTRSFDPALSVDIGYSRYGAASAITDPSTSVPAPDGVYSVFN